MSLALIDGRALAQSRSRSRSRSESGSRWAGFAFHHGKRFSRNSKQHVAQLYDTGQVHSFIPTQSRPASIPSVTASHRRGSPGRSQNIRLHLHLRRLDMNHGTWLDTHSRHFSFVFRADYLMRSREHYLKTCFELPNGNPKHRGQGISALALLIPAWTTNTPSCSIELDCLWTKIYRLR